MRIGLIVSLCFFAAVLPHGLGAGTISTSQIQTRTVITPNADFVLADPALTWEKLRDDPFLTWHAVNRNTVNFGFTRDAVFVRFALKNDEDHARVLVIGSTDPRTDHLTAYFRHPGRMEVMHAGDAEIPATSVQSLSHVFRLEIPAGESVDAWIRFQGREAMHIELFVSDPGEYQSDLVMESTSLGIYFGALAFLIISNLIMYSAGRETTFLFYSTYLASSLYIVAGMTGVLFKVFKNPVLVHECAVLASVVVGVSLILFIRGFLNTRRSLPLTDIWLRFLGVGAAAVLIVELGAGFGGSVLYIHVYGLLTAPSMLIAGLVAVRKDVVQSRAFLLGWGLFCGFLVLEGMSAFNLIPANMITRHGFMIGLLAEAAVFTIALAVRARGRIADRAAAENRMRTMEHEMQLARRSQARILPPTLPALSGLFVETRYLPYFSVGGDFYAFLEPGPDRLGILIADVAGHGLSAALDASTVRIAFNSARQYAADPGRLLSAMNEFLIPYVDYRFVSAAYALIDIKERALTISGAGHPPVLLSGRAPGSGRYVEAPGQILGIGPFEYRNVSAPLLPGDKVILYTDGLYERLLNPPDDSSAEVMKMVDTARSRTGRPFIDEVIAIAAKQRQGPQTDDVTIVVAELVVPAPLESRPAPAALRARIQ